MALFVFAYHEAPKNDGLINSEDLFYEAVHHGDTVAPEAVSDLVVGRNGDKTGLIFAWTAPADNNGTGPIQPAVPRRRHSGKGSVGRG